MKKLGLIGGMSCESTIHYYKLINSKGYALTNNKSYPEIVIYSVNFKLIISLMNDNKWDEIGSYLNNIAKEIDSLGIDYIAITTNTIHKVADLITKDLKCQFIDILDCSINKCKKFEVKNIGLLGTRCAMTEGFLINRYKENDINVYCPEDLQIIERVDKIIFNELCFGRINPESKTFLVNLIEDMVKEYNIECIVLSCTELNTIIKPKDISIRLIDSTAEHIEGILKKIIF